MTSTNRTIRRRNSRYLWVTIFSIGLAFASAPVATAEWDIWKYDDCIAGGWPVINCCIDSGGEWTGTYAGDPSGKCVAPPVNDAMTGQPAPPRSPEEIVGGPVRDFNVPDANVPDAPVVVLPTP